MRPDQHDLDDEIRGHLAISEHERIARGDSPDAARLAARKEFGNLSLTRDSMGSVWRSRWRDLLGGLAQDAGYAVRLLKRSRAFSAIVVLVLGIGIAGNAGAFALFKAAVLRPLPGVPDAAGLTTILGRTRNGDAVPLPYPDYEYLRDHDSSFTSLAAAMVLPLNLGLGDRGERIWGEIVSGNYFQTLGVSASLGRTLLPSDDGIPGQPPIAVISEGLWRRTFDAARDVVGRTVIVNGHTLTIAGVTSGGFHGSFVALQSDLFVPVTMQPQLAPPDVLHDRDAGPFAILGHVRPGLSHSAAAAQIGVLSRQLSADFPMDTVPTRAAAVPLWQSPFGAQTYILPIVALMGAVGVLLLVVVSANLANLVLARSVGRRGEIAVRRALGASRVRVMRLLLFECLVLAVPGALAGLALSLAIGHLNPAGSSAAAAAAPASFEMSIGLADIAFALALSVVSALLFGFVPALRTARVPLVSVIKDEGFSGGRSKGRLRAGLVVSQIAVSLLLLVGAGLAGRTLLVARHADAGFDPRGVVSVSVDVKPSGYDEVQGRDFYERLLDRLRAAPGVDAATLASVVPLRLVPGPWRRTGVEGYEPRRDESLNIPFTVVADGYFQALRIPLAAGRAFNRFDRADGPLVVVVDEAMARRFWTGAEAALGKRIRLHGSWWTIVGVAGDVKHQTLTEQPVGHVYMPFGQDYQPDMTIHVRSAALDVSTLMDRVRNDVRALDPNLPILEAHALGDQVKVGLFGYEIAASMLAVVSAMAIGLAALGIYGLLSYTVQQSAHEIGIRLALGAQRAGIVRLFLRRGLRLGSLGISVGLVLSLATSRLAATLLYGVGPTDAISFGGAFLVVAGIVLAASFVPAWHAGRTELPGAIRRL